MKRLPTLVYIPLAFALVKILLHLATANTLGFHRDEFLYLALGRHLDWGFWSNPPFIGFVSWLSQNLLGDSLMATRFLPALCGGGLVLLTGLMVRDLGGGRFAQVLCGTAMLFSIAWLRAYSMLQPVPFDVFFWALLSFGLLKWLKTNDTRWWWFIGATAGIGFLNKYSIVFWAAALLGALLVTPQRKVLATRMPWLAAGLALLILSPNLLWQWQYNFPVVHHMEELARYQLQNVVPVNFLVDQLLFHGPGGAALWIAGLIFLLRAPVMQPYRLLGWFYVAILLVFLALNGKSYYTLGAYPVLFAAGAVWWERFLQKAWPRAVLVAAVVAPALPLFPTGIPVWRPERLVQYFRGLTDKGIVAVRWEDGELHPLPQDYADMLGWVELEGLAYKAAMKAGNNAYIIYGDNYGQAGAVDYFVHSTRLLPNPTVASFSDSYRLWAPDTLAPDVKTLIYINDEDPGEDVQELFADIQLIGKVENTYARERGTGVWLCREPRSSA
ncbi:MAG TPA: glycosyltransferase family 39 protein, partial [Saprospiraceae bacterium]|nr:glycosyltransferase family 39 protein [Saprospiraceae bacterium]